MTSLGADLFNNSPASVCLSILTKINSVLNTLGELYQLVWKIRVQKWNILKQALTHPKVAELFETIRKLYGKWKL